ncbi:MAG: FAD-binding protein [Lachnospiraceae bacterium]|nr:FAD-binding protein [Lachnospiraceae bacterium]
MRTGESVMDYLKGISEGVLRWPYPVKYGQVRHITVDVCVIGCGTAGASAAVAAARCGLKVAAVDKAPIKHSGNAGAGMDHWNMTINSPSNPFTPEEIAEKGTFMCGKRHGPEFYIAMKGSWEALMELADLGMPIYDEDGDFEGQPALDEATGVLKAFDYSKVTTVRLRGGQYIKTSLFDGLRKYGAEIYERIMMTALLTEGGKQGARVVGAVGFSLETGEAYVFHAKTVIIGSGGVSSAWCFSTEISGSSYFWDPNETGEGIIMALNAGAKISGFDGGGKLGGRNPMGWPNFGVGNSGNTWYPCTLVDDNGKKVPWYNKYTGEEVKDFKDLMFRPMNVPPKYGDREDCRLDPHIPEKIKSGEYKLPFWADLSDVPEAERRLIWGVMIGNEGKSRYAIYDYYTRSGFNPDRDLLWAPIEQPDSTRNGPGHRAEPGMMKLWRSEQFSRGDIVVDWNLESNVRGLYAVGATCGMEGCSYACSTGFYAGNRAAEYCREFPLGEIDEEQLNTELDRIWAPVRRADDPNAYVTWKEMWGGTTRVMQTCCGEWKDKSVLEFGLMWLKSIKDNEMQQMYARNPHELGRVLECQTRMRSSEMFLRSGIAKIEKDMEIWGSKEPPASIPRQKGFGAPDPTSYDFMYTYFENGEFKAEFKEDRYWLKDENLPGYLENYELHREKEGEEQRKWKI